MYPTEYRYTKEHEWLSIEDDVAIVGITDHAQNQLGDIVYVELPETGQEYERGDEFGSVESVKAVAEVYMPVTGEIIEINENLEDEPEMINKSAHEKGWLVKIKLSDKDELEDLMDAATYEEFANEENS